MRLYQITSLNERERLLELIEADIGLELWIDDLEKIIMRNLFLLDWYRQGRLTEVSLAIQNVLTKRFLKKVWPAVPSNVLYSSFKIEFYREAYRRGFSFSPTFLSALEWVEDLNRDHAVAKRKRKNDLRRVLLKVAASD